MKKILSLILALALVMSLSVTAFAAEDKVVTDGGNGTATVYGTYNAGGTASDTISVNITWGSMAFTYTAESEGTWNPETHNYDNKTAASWTCAEGANVITITNHSNIGVKATATFNPTTGFAGSFDNNEVTLATAEDTTVANAPKGEIKFNITSGTMTAGQENVELGTITVTIAKSTT